MMTWRLWRALQNPLFSHPFYWQIARRPLLDSKRLQRGLVVGVLAAVIGVVFCRFQIFPLMFGVLSYGMLLMPLVFVAVLMSANWYGIRWAVDISRIISRERERGLYDLVSLSPGGALAASWAVCSRCLHANRSLSKLRSQLLLALVVVSPVPMSVWFTIVVSPNELPEKIVASVSLLALLAAFYLDYVQSAVVSSLVGMLSATQTRHRFDALSWALMGFLLIQAATYVIVLLGIGVILPTLYALLKVEGWGADLSFPIGALLLLYGVREGIITWLWRAMMERLNTDLTELDGMMAEMV